MVQLSKQGIFNADGSGINSNLLLSSSGTIIDKRNNALDSRTEYYAWNVGQSYMNITSTTPVVISFDLEMLVRNITGYNGNMLIYNTNNGGLVQIATTTYSFKTEFGIDDYINKRIVLPTTLTPRANATKTDNYIEFYTGYGTNNFYKISNVKIELGSIGTSRWIPNPVDTIYTTNNHGFIEGENIGKIFSGHVEAHEFIEW